MKTICLTLICIFTNLAYSQSPTLEWARSFGGPSTDQAISIAKDASGNTVMTGSFEGTIDLDPGAGVFNVTSNGGSDLFIIKLDPNGSMIWAKVVGGPGNDTGLSISIDASGASYVTGTFENTVDLDPNAGVFDLTSNGMADIFTLKLDANGNFVWAVSVGGQGGEVCQSNTTDIAGNVYLTGNFGDTVDFDPGPNTFNMISQSSSNIFVLKLDTDGNFVWARSFGGITGQQGFSVAVDATENAYLTGNFGGTVDFDPGSGSYNITANGALDAYVQKLDINGDFVWARSFVCDTISNGWAIATDISGNACLTGSFIGTVDLDPGATDLLFTSNGSSSAYIVKLDAAGDLIWGKVNQGLFTNVTLSITTDILENVYTSGYFFGTVDLDPSAANFNLTSNGQADAFVQKLDANGNFIWAFATGDSLQDLSFDVVTDGEDHVYSLGRFEGSVDLDPGSSISNHTSNGGFDVYVQKLAQCVPNTLDTGLLVSDPTLTANAIGVDYQWLDCNNGFAEIVGETGQTFSPSTNGSYAVELTQNGCIDTSACATISTVGFEEFSAFDQVSVFPNPSNGSITVKLGNLNDVSIKVFDLMGQILYQAKGISSPIHQLDLSSASGAYLIEISTMDKKHTSKLLIQ